MSICLPFRRLLFLVFIVAVVAGCSKKGSPPQDDDDVDTAYTDDSEASDDKAAALPSGLRKTKSDPAAKKIMQEVRDAYKHFSSYDDICEMESRLRNAKSADNTGFADTTKVLTNFARPDCLRVEIQSLNRFNSNVGASFLWGNGKKTEQYNGASDGEMYQFFDTPEAIAGNWATLLATSGEFNPIVPLLLPDKLKKKSGVEKPFFDKLRILKLEGEEKVDGAMCHRIEATIDPEDIKNQLNTNVSLFTAAEANRIESKATIWVDKNSKLVHKIHHYMLSLETSTKDPDFGTVKIPGLRIDLKYTFKSRINRPQSWSDLAFGEPNASEEQPVSAAAVADATFKKTKKSRDEARKYARTLLDASVAAYGKCKTYADRGEIILKPIDRRDTNVQTIQFTTAYKRGGGFRFGHEFKNAEGDTLKHTCWSDGETFKSWYSESNQTTEHGGMNALIDELVGMQNVQARHVLGLFDDASFGKSELSKLESPIFLGTEKVDGKTCQKLMARESHRWIVFLWIQASTKLIHKIETRDLGNGNPVWLTITMKPTANKKVSDKVLKF